MIPRHHGFRLLGHLHIEPTPEHFDTVGRLDVVKAPADGGMTPGFREESEVEVSLRTLPARPTVIALLPRRLD